MNSQATGRDDKSGGKHALAMNPGGNFGSSQRLARPADLEIGDTAGLETCATSVAKVQWFKARTSGSENSHPLPLGGNSDWRRLFLRALGESILLPFFG